MKIKEELDGNAFGEDSDIDWTTDEDDEIGTEVQAPSSLAVGRPGNGVTNGEPSSSNAVSSSKLVKEFVEMKFPEELVLNVIKENGEGDPNLILSVLLSYAASEDSACLSTGSPLQQLSEPQRHQSLSSDPSSSDYTENLLDDFSDLDGWSELEVSEDEIVKPSNFISERHKRLLSMEKTGALSEDEHKLLSLANMGYTIEEASIAIDRCGPSASVAELTDCILAAQLSREADIYLPEDNHMPRHSNGSMRSKKRKFTALSKTKNVEVEMIRLPNPMIGYGVPSMPSERVKRPIPEGVQGPPFFYYENVALAPKGVWDTISRFLYEVEPEFVDSKYFSATARKRGYIHNLPLENRFPLVPLPPMTISQAFPLSKKYWPKWDPREKMNCIQTALGSAKLSERIRNAIERYTDEEPPDSVKKYVLEQCRKWNLIWTGKNKVAPLEPDEMETLLGFPKNHTRGGGISRTDRIKSLGNSFQVDTVAYHLSVLKDIFPEGVNVLSLFSGIGGGEVALHRLGIKLKNVVSVEKSKVNRDIVRSWWEQTNQSGHLIDFDDVQKVDEDVIGSIMSSIGPFDLVIGGSPCNNLAGSNRVSRDGLEGQESSLFYEYFRILDTVRAIMAKPGAIPRM